MNSFIYDACLSNIQFALRTVSGSCKNCDVSKDCIAEYLNVVYLDWI